ncbi:MAG: alanyl-tRNA editing protein [Thermoplasmata archaeon]|nr:alanyl-tRNA editing protein [Thermoplasmata archaeon]
MTELAYLADIAAAYERRFEARVLALPPGAVVLDRTFFYPTGGGQPADAGTLGRPDTAGRWSIMDVQRKAGTVLHRVGRGTAGLAPLRIGEPVVGELDWERRYRHMRLHTGQHLLSARLFTLSGRRTANAKFSGTSGELELEAGPGEIPPSDELNRDVAERVAADPPLRIRYMPRAEFERAATGRSSALALPAGVDPVRVVEIDGADECPCGGTHLRRLGEVGVLTVLAPAPLAGGGVKISFRLRAPSPSTPRG